MTRTAADPPRRRRLVGARNARGDSAALYAFFEKYARFIDP